MGPHKDQILAYDFFAMKTIPLIELHDPSKNNGTKTAVDCVSLNVFAGEVFGCWRLQLS